MRGARSLLRAWCWAPALLLAAVKLARAERGAVQWSAPAGCPDGAAVTADVERILGRPFAADVRAEATVRREGDGAFVLHLEMTGKDGKAVRELRGETCENVARATAAIIALSIASSAEPAAAATSKPSSSPTATVTPPAETPRTARREPSPPMGSLRAGAGFDALALPRFAPTATLAGGLVLDRVRVEAFGAYVAGERAVIAGTAPTRGGDLKLAYGGARGCYLPWPARVEVSGCVGLEVGSIFGSGFGVSRPAAAGALWLSPSFGALGVLRLSRNLGLALDLYGVVPLVRRSFVLAGRGEVFQPPAASVRAALGVEARFR